MNAGSQTLNPVSQPVSADITQFVQRLAQQAKELAGRVNDKLQPIMRNENPPTCNEKAIPARDYPPLFEEYRVNLRAIEDALYYIDSSLSRTELP